MDVERNELVEGTAGSKKVWGLGETVIVSLLTGYAYFIAYAFNIGSAAFLGVPSGYVSVGASQVIGLAVFVIAAVGFPAVIMLHQAGTYQRVSHHFADPRIRAVVALLCIAAVYISLYAVLGVSRFFGPAAPWLGFIVFGVSYLILAATLFSLSKGPQGRVSLVAFYVLNVLLTTIAVSYALGFKHASDSPVLRIITDGEFKDYAIVWELQPDLVLADRYDMKERTLLNEVALIKVEKDTPLRWHVVPVDGLKSRNSIRDCLRCNPFLPP